MFRRRRNLPDQPIRIIAGLEGFNGRDIQIEWQRKK